MGVIGCYSIDLYCDDPKHGPEHGHHGDQMTGETLGQCVAVARADGWSISYRDRGTWGIGRALCPFHNKRKRKRKRPVRS